MSSAQEYYDSLMAQGYTPEQAKGFTQQHFPGFSPTAPIVILPQTLMPQMGVETGVPLGGTMSVQGDRPSVLNWVALGLTLAAITMVFIAMFTNSWMIGEEDEYWINFGLSEFEFSEDGEIASSHYSDSECQRNEECSDVGSAGTTGLIFLWTAIGMAICSLVLMCLNNFNVFHSKFGMIVCFVSGAVAMTGATIWLIMFPTIDGLDEANLSPGISWYLAIIAGVFSIGSGVCEATS